MMKASCFPLLLIFMLGYAISVLALASYLLYRPECSVSLLFQISSRKLEIFHKRKTNYSLTPR